MSEAIYLTTFQRDVNLPEFTYLTDREYQEFFECIQKEAAIQNMDKIWKKKIYNAWYKSKTVQQHWSTPQKGSDNAMLWTVYHRDWDYEEGMVLMLAWFRHHHRKITAELLERFEEKIARPCWEQCQPFIQDKERQQEEKRMEAKKAKLHYRIIEVLTRAQSTTAAIAAELNESPKAVEGQLYRMVRKGEVVKVAWGLYAVPEAKTEEVAA